jgi:hypothetical protein
LTSIKLPASFNERILRSAGVPSRVILRFVPAS